MANDDTGNRRKKPMSLVVVIIETGEATPLTPATEARIIRGACDLLEDRADELDPLKDGGQDQ